MRNPENVLNSLNSHGKDPKYKFERLYRILFNEEMYYLAYQKLSGKTGNMTPGTDKQTIDLMSIARIEQLITKLKDESYQPKPSKRIYIPKKNGGKRPLGIPAFEDKLLQEVVRMILEAIYESRFEDTSHGFRPKRSCHTAINKIQKSFAGTAWMIEGDIKGFFDNINHDVLIEILKERINDNRFIRLMWKFLKAGYLEEWTYHKTYSGTPQGGIISPILANIYLDKLDKYVKEYVNNFDKGKHRKVNQEYRSYRYKKGYYVKKLESVNTETERERIVEQIKYYERKMLQTDWTDYMSDDYKRLKYVRYADDFLMGVVGSKAEAQKIKEEIKVFLQERLRLQLSDEKTLITHNKKSASFLGFEVKCHKSNQAKRDVMGRMRRSLNKTVSITVPQDKVKSKLLELDVLEVKIHNGREIWKPKSRPSMMQNDDLEILSKYNAEIRGLYNYYSIAYNCSTLHSFKHIMEYSMYKTFAQKYRTSVVKICKKYKRNGVFTVSYKTKNGERYRTFYSEGFTRKKPTVEKDVDQLPNLIKHYARTSLIDRLKAEKCEYCGSPSELRMHHVRKIKDLTGKTPIERFIIARKRKTVAICHECHKKLHAGEL